MSRLPSALPHEVWEDIFYWATLSEARAASCVLGPPGSNVFTDTRISIRRRDLRECEESAGRQVRAGAGVSPLAVAFAAVLAGRDLD